MQLKNAYNEPLPLSSLLIHVEVTHKEARDENYQSLQALREQMRRQNAEREDLIKEMLKEQANHHVDQGISQRLQNVNLELRMTEDEVCGASKRRGRVERKPRKRGDGGDREKGRREMDRGSGRVLLGIFRRFASSK